jgi:hypothetical protein
MPGKAATLMTGLPVWQTETAALLPPGPNPNYDPKAERTRGGQGNGGGGQSGEGKKTDGSANRMSHSRIQPGLFIRYGKQQLSLIQKIGQVVVARLVWPVRVLASLGFAEFQVGAAEKAILFAFASFDNDGRRL